MNAKNQKPSKSIKPTKSTQPATQTDGHQELHEPHVEGATPGATSTPLVRIHDLMGFAVISLPKALREVIGDEAFESTREELDDYGFTVIIRRPNDVVYIKLPIQVMSDQADGLGGPAAVEAPAQGERKRKTRGKAAAPRAAKPAAKSSVKPTVKPAPRTRRGN